jgi:hypothetical protein
MLGTVALGQELITALILAAPPFTPDRHHAVRLLTVELAWSDWPLDAQSRPERPF